MNILSPFDPRRVNNIRYTEQFEVTTDRDEMFQRSDLVQIIDYANLYTLFQKS